MKKLKNLAAIAFIIAITPTLAEAQLRKSDTTEITVRDGKEQSGTSYTLSFDDPHPSDLFEIVFGYANKSWRCTYPEQAEQREDFFGDSNKFLHGFQFGGLFTPAFNWGLGLRTGLLIEGYISESQLIKEYCNYFSEFDLYIPMHASFYIPFSETQGLKLFGGMGFQWAATGGYYRRTAGWTSGTQPKQTSTQLKKQEYGNGWPQKVNWQAECGFYYCLGSIGLSFTYSFGIVDHGINKKSFNGGEPYIESIKSIKSRQDKMQASITLMF